MTRNEKILARINKNGHGIEIGPSHAPIAPKREGYHVDIIDHLGRDDLLVKYKDHNVNLDNIEEVDYVWRGQTYSELTGKPKHYDWIIASHVIEHTPDLIGFLINCDAVLRDDGVLSLVIPDKRYCFDHFRPITGLSSVIDKHYSANKIHSAGAIAEYFLNVVSKDGAIGWQAHSEGTYNLVHTRDEARINMQAVIEHNAYIDVHAWCFVPHSFRLLVNDLYDLGLIAFKEVSFQPTQDYEFYITLSRQGAGIDKTRLEMLSCIETELKDENIELQHQLQHQHHQILATTYAELKRPSIARRIVRRLRRTLSK
jgi:predicted SAM-dependent methyltransferase